MGTTQKVPNKYSEEDAKMEAAKPEYDVNGEIIVKQMPSSLESSGILGGNMMVNL